MFKLFLVLMMAMVNGLAFASTEISTPGTNIGIGTNSVANALSIAGGWALGNATYTQTTAPTFGVIIQGNVGIGSITPGQLLDVYGTIRGNAFLTNGSGESAIILTANASDISQPAAGFGGIYEKTDKSLYFKDESGTVSNLLSASAWTASGSNIYPTTISNNIGIGTTVAAQQLTIFSNSTNPQVTAFSGASGSFPVFALNDGRTSGHNWNIENGRTLGYFQLRDNTAAGIRFTIDSNGNVGIGTTFPVSGLDIKNGSIALIAGADNNLNSRTTSTTKLARVGSYPYVNADVPNAVFVANNTSTNNILNLGGGSNTMNAATDIHLYTAATTTTTTGTERVTVSSAGNVGLGSTNPGVILDVAGSIRSTSFTAGQALCAKSDQSIGQCTGSVGAGGACTCS